jgi:hypothetical protein
MEIRSDRRYHFEVARARLWAEIADPDHYRSWWPWLRRFEADALTPGARWRCVIQPPLPYTLRVDVDIVDVLEGEAVAAEVSGDLSGRARISLSDGNGSSPDHHCVARVVSNLSPANRVLGAAAWLVSPAARWGHDWVLTTGARQLGEALNVDDEASAGP